MIEEAGKAIISQGGAWAALFILATFAIGGALVWAMKGWMACLQDRVADNKAMSDIVHANAVAMEAATRENEARVRALEVTSRANELVAERQAALVTEVRGLKDELARRGSA